MFVSEYSRISEAETTSEPVRIFRVVLLFSYQRTLSAFCELVSFASATACLYYHTWFCLSRTFLLFLKTFLKHFFSSKVVVLGCRSCISATFFILTPCKVFVNSFLKNFFFFLKTVYNSSELFSHRSVPRVSRLVYNITPSMICKPLNYK